MRAAPQTVAATPSVQVNEETRAFCPAARRKLNVDGWRMTPTINNMSYTLTQEQETFFANVVAELFGKTLGFRANEKI